MFDIELYFNKQYAMKLSKQEKQKYEAWNKSYPPDTWEIERNKRITKVQGNNNPFIVSGGLKHFVFLD